MTTLRPATARALTEEPRVRSLLQLIVQPERCDGRKVDLGAYVVLDPIHGLGFLEYGVDRDGGSPHIIDSSPIGFDLSSVRCAAAHAESGPILSADQIRGHFAERKAGSAFVRATFEYDSRHFDGGRICDITDLRLLPDAN